jgi:hypothetical protein
MIAGRKFKIESGNFIIDGVMVYNTDWRWHTLIFIAD